MADQNTIADQQRLTREQAGDIRRTAAKIPADKGEQKVTRSTEGTVERTTSDNERKS